MLNTRSEPSTCLNNMEGLFTLKNTPAIGSTESEVVVGINASHGIFAGHFPDQPVLPGVCMVQIAITIAGAMHGKALRVVNARTMKFLAPVDPNKTPELLYRTTLTPLEGAVKAEVQATAEGASVVKLSLELVAE